MAERIALAPAHYAYRILRVPDLLADELRCACLVLPLAQKQLAQERVQRLLLASQFLAATRVLLLQRADEPLKHQQSALRGVLLGGGCDEYGGVFGPVRRELGERLGGEDEGRRRHGREVAIERGNRLSHDQLGLSQQLRLITFRKLVQEPRDWGGTAEPSFSAMMIAVEV
jgi:hypothetical protein